MRSPSGHRLFLLIMTAAVLSIPCRCALAETSTSSLQVPQSITISGKLPAAGIEQSINLQLAADHDRLHGTVEYTENKVVLMTASLDVTPNSIASQGSVDGVSFSHTLLDIDDPNAMTIDIQVGDAVFCPLVDGQHTQESVVLRQYEALSTVIERGSSEKLIQRMAVLFSDTRLSDVQRSALLIVATAAVGGPTHAMGWIDDYVGCLQNECASCGGCWNGSGCHYCPGSGTAAGWAGLACYTIGAEKCFVKAIKEFLINFI